MHARFGLVAFLKECQHKVKELAEGIVLKFDAAKHMKSWTDDEIKAAIANGKLVPFARRASGASRSP